MKLIDEIVALDQLVLRDYRKRGHPIVDKTMRRAALEVSLIRSECVCVRRLGRMVAYCYMWPEKPGIWFVGGIAVHPECINASVMRELLHKSTMLVRDKCIRILRSHVYKANVGSVQLHGRLGFEITNQNALSLEFTHSDDWRVAVCFA